MLYLDNSSTTRIDPEVLDAMMPYLMEEYGNPSSKYYTLASNAQSAIEEARQNVAHLLGCENDEVIFTSGATESNNMILKGVIDFYFNTNSSNHIVTTLSEHPSIIETCKYLEEKGVKTIYNPVDHYARVKLNDLKISIKEKPLLVSVIWGNNEVGSLNPIQEISKLCYDNDVYFHTDATQVIGKINIDMNKLPGVKFLSLSGHKINGPKGIGACIIRKEDRTIYTKITPLLHGGGQENGYRSGTLAVHNIVGLGAAALLAKKRMDENNKKLQELEKHLLGILSNKLGDKLVVNSDKNNKIPGLLSLQFKGVNNEIFIKKLSNQIALSTGSACSSSKPSHVLEAMGLTLEEIRQTIRITLSPEIEISDLNIFRNL